MPKGASESFDPRTEASVEDSPFDFHPYAAENVGRVALMRGPVVYAADSAYLPSGPLLDDIVVSLDVEKPTDAVQVKKDETTNSVHLLVPTALSKPPLGQS